MTLFFPSFPEINFRNRLEVAGIIQFGGAMVQAINRRKLLAKGGILAPAAGLAAIIGADAANAGQAAGTAHRIAGTWHVDISFPGPVGNPPEKGLFLFTETGAVICTNTRIRDLGLGKWLSISSSRFSFTFRHHMYGPDGTWMGTLDIAHSGTVTGNTFSSTGTGTVYNTDGTLSESVSSQVTGVRY
ncbi:hypothetical protein OG339_18640 [Streptosporangium sp. NBC_01495]|uniref:hypothetical protein n=1 Tax=Streptosporangium sp. NBC_01495 TaxID=2903899 RepID=UPI002E318129|nr:hypothetical protein [Streptosporangium sp. NBC_01495]